MPRGDTSGQERDFSQPRRRGASGAAQLPGFNPNTGRTDAKRAQAATAGGGREQAQQSRQRDIAAKGASAKLAATKRADLQASRRADAESYGGRKPAAPQVRKQAPTMTKGPAPQVRKPRMATAGPGKQPRKDSYGSPGRPERLPDNYRQPAGSPTSDPAQADVLRQNAIRRSSFRDGVGRPGGMMGGADAPMMATATPRYGGADVVHPDIQAQQMQAKQQAMLQAQKQRAMLQAQQPMGAPQQFPGAGPMAGAPMQRSPMAPAMPMGAAPGMMRPPMSPGYNPAYAGGAMQMRQAQVASPLTKAPMMQGQAPSLTAPAAPSPAPAAPKPVAPTMPKPQPGFG